MGFSPEKTIRAFILAGAAFLGGATAAHAQDGPQHRMLDDSLRLVPVDTTARPDLDGVRYFMKKIPALQNKPMVGPLRFDNGGIGHINLDYYRDPTGATRYVLIAGFDKNGDDMLSRDEITTIRLSVVDTATHDNVETLEAQRYPDGSGVVTKKVTLIDPKTHDVRKHAEPKDHITPRQNGIDAWIDMINDVVPPHLLSRKKIPPSKPGLIQL